VPNVGSVPLDFGDRIREAPRGSLTAPAPGDRTGKAVTAGLETFGRIGIVVDNAGIARSGSEWATSSHNPFGHVSLASVSVFEDTKVKRPGDSRVGAEIRGCLRKGIRPASRRSRFDRSPRRAHTGFRHARGSGTG
jgi:hypothetical protein